MANELQQLTFNVTPIDGSFTIEFDGQSTSPIDYDASASDVLSALEALSNIGTGNISVSSISTGYQLEFTGALSSTNLDQVTVDASELTAADNTIVVTTTTAGLPARSAGPATLSITDPANGSWYESWNHTGIGGAPLIFCTVTITIDGQALGYGPAGLGLAGNDPAVAGPWSVDSELASFLASLSPPWSVSGTLDGGGTLTITCSDDSSGHSASATNMTSMQDDGLGDDTSGFQSFFSSIGSFTDGSNDTLGTEQIDQIVLDSAVNGGTFHIGSVSGISYDDNGSGVQPAIDSLLGSGVATVALLAAGVWSVTYNSTGDMSTNTTMLVGASQGDSLTQPVVASTSTIRDGTAASPAWANNCNTFVNC